MMYTLLLHTALLKCFIYCEVKASQILHGTTVVACTKNKVNTISIYLIRKKFPSFQIIYYLHTSNSNHKKTYAYLTDSQYSTCLLKKYRRLQHLKEREGLQACKTSDLFFWLIFLVNSPPSMTTLRLPDFSSMNATFSKSSQFQMSIPITTFYERSLRDFIS